MTATINSTLSRHARILYEYLRRIASRRQVVTYADVHRDTGVPIGEEGGYMGQRLGEIFEACDAAGLPPLTAIVVRQGAGGNELYDRSMRHGMPGPGYFRACAHSPNQADRREDPDLDRWAQSPAPPGFDPDVERWRYREMIEEHQNTVWARRDWPCSL